MDIPIYSWTSKKPVREIEEFLKRPAFDDRAEAVASELLADIRKRGDVAVVEAAKRIDGVSLRPQDMLVPESEVEAACASVTPSVRRNVKEAVRRVTAFAKGGMRKDWHMATRRGGQLGERFLPLDRVGVYIPGGTAPLASTAVMTATLAKVAGVQEIVACTPCGKDGKVNPVLLFAMKAAGVTEIYRVGGIQAIGMMAYGTASVRPVQKIVGPGGAFVTAAKRLVYGHVALDLVAGPSEVCIIADKTANPAWLAADLLAQIEHGTGHEKALLITDDADLAKAVADQVAAQLPLLPREPRMRPTIENGGLMLVVVPDIDKACQLANAFAPEHLEVALPNARRHLSKLKAAGAIFLGHWTTESAGDFAAGPSHVLPTGGAAAKFSGLTVDDFRRRTSLIEYAKDDLADALPIIEAFGEIEGLAAHSRAATIRME